MTPYFALREITMTAPAPAPITYIELPWKDVVRVWWAWLWRTLVTGFIVIFLGSLLFGSFAAFIGLPPSFTGWVVTIFSMSCWLGVGLYFFGEIFAIDFGHFRIRAIPKSPDESSPVEIPSLLKS